MLATLSYVHVSALSLHGLIGEGFQSTTFSRRSSFFVKTVQSCLALTDICRSDMQPKNESPFHDNSDSDNEYLRVSIDARRLKGMWKWIHDSTRLAHWSIHVGDEYYELQIKKTWRTLWGGRTKLKVTDAPRHPFSHKHWTLPKNSWTTMSQEQVRKEGALNC